MNRSARALFGFCLFAVFSAYSPGQDSTRVVMPDFDGSQVHPSTSTFSTKFSMMGQELNLTSRRKVSSGKLEGREIWRVVEQANGPVGAIDDTTDLDAKTLLPIRRSAVQGGGTILLNFKPGVIDGRIAGGGMDLPVSIRTFGPVLTDGGGAELAIATLPLSNGYSTTLNGVDIINGTAKKLLLNVLSVESVTVGAGTFEAYKVEVKSAVGDGKSITLWINTDDRRTVKIETKLPEQLGGGVSVTELVR